jgi:hypothetical protein
VKKTHKAVFWAASISYGLMQFTHDGTCIAVVVAGKVAFYGKKTT